MAKKNESQRKADLFSDPWVEKSNEKGVTCKACGGVLLLDQRRKWYTFPWRKHKLSCSKIPDTEGRVGIAKRAARREAKAIAKSHRAAHEAAKFQAVKKRLAPRKTLRPAAARKARRYLATKVDDSDLEMGGDESTEDEDRTEVEGCIEGQGTEEDIAAAWILVKMKHNIF